MRYRFSGCVVDTDRMEVWRDGERVHVEPQVFDVLVYLVARCDRVVTKEELLDEVWGSRFVTASALTSRIKAARRAVGDDGATQRVITTVRGRGFRLVAAVDVDDTATVDDGSAASPASAVPAERPGPVRALPRPLARVVGRDGDIAAALAVLDRSRLVTVLGPGGVGKTTLAMEIAHRACPRFGDEAYWCDWAAVTDEAEAADAFADAIAVNRQPELDVRGSIVVGIGNRRMLVVADNCEHILAGAAGLLSDVVSACPQLTVLATSRSPLAVAGEALVPVAPLAWRTPDDGPDGGAAAGEWSAAASLFVDRAQAADPAVSLDGRRRQVEALCARLDGLPLALELAAARLRSATFDEVADHLTQALDVASAVQRGRVRRHQTLRDTIEWSYRLLADDERGLLAQLWVLTGQFGAEDAAGLRAALGDQAPVVPLLAALVDRSVLVADRSARETRYGLLETLRAYAHGTVTPEDERRVRAAHAAWACDLAEHLNRDVTGPAEASAVRRFDQLFSNFRRAQHHAIDTGDVEMALRLTAALHYYASHRLRDEVFTWAEATLAMPAAAEHPLGPVALGALAQGLAFRGDLDRARALAQRAVSLCGDDDPRALWALRTLSNVALYEGRLDDCVVHAEREVAIADRIGDHTHAGYAFVTHVLANAYAGRLDQAGRRLAEQEVRADRSRNPTQLAWARFVRGEMLSGTDPAAALDALWEAHELGESVGSEFVIGVASVAIGSTQARLGRRDDALAMFARTIRRWHQRGDWTHQWTTLRNVVGLLHEAGQHAEAARLYGAVTVPGRGAPSYGDAAARLGDAARGIAEQVGRDRFGELVEAGRRAGPDDAVELALGSIASLVGDRPGTAGR